jgi:DNA-directed RNA polymerase
MAHLFNNYCIENKINKENIEEVYIKYKEQLRKLICEKNSIASSQISKKISTQYKALIFQKLIEKINGENNSFYLPYLIDFRGRTYKLSSISPTFFKEIRECLSFSGKENKKIEKDIKELENKINSIILKNESKLENIVHYTNLKNLEEKKKISVI